MAHISPKVLFIVHAGDSAVTTVTMESYMLFPSPRFLRWLFLNVMLYKYVYMSDLSFSVCVCIGDGSGISYVFWECVPFTKEDETTMTVNYTVQSCNLESGY